MISSSFSIMIFTLSVSVFIFCFLACENSAQLFKGSTSHLADKKEALGADNVLRSRAVDP